MVVGIVKSTRSDGDEATCRLSSQRALLALRARRRAARLRAAPVTAVDHAPVVSGYTVRSWGITASIRGRRLCVCLVLVVRVLISVEKGRDAS